MKLIRTLTNALIDDNDKYMKILGDIEKIHDFRNTIAHNHFRLSPDKRSVEFLIISTDNKKTRLATVKSDNDEFDNHFETMRSLHNNLEKLRNKLKESTNNDKLVQAMSDVPPNLFTKNLD